uniref:Uncharacterized protein n=1 Tax=Solanum lycopersicum TaxID=4081 RepID=A0A3Q7II90_SOLLC
MHLQKFTCTYSAETLQGAGFCAT